MTSTDIPRPLRYKKWLIWPDTVLSILNISDCNDTINGICLSNKSLLECMDECTTGCGVGYRLVLPNGKSVCVPVRTDIHPYLNPVYRLRRKEYYPDLKNVEIATFINTEIYPFPLETGNVVFYRDILTLSEVTDGLTIGTLDAQIEGKGVILMGEGSDDNIQLLPAQMSTPLAVQYFPVRFGDYVHISVPGTSLIAQADSVDGNILKWELTTGSFHGNEFSFRIMPSSKSQRVGGVISCDDVFIIQSTDDSIVVVDPVAHSLRLEYINIPDVLDSDTVGVRYKFVSKMTGYYCDKGKCKSIPIENTETNGAAARYNDAPVERNPSCWGLCDGNGFNSFRTLSTKGGSKVVLIILSIVIILTILSIIIFFVRKRYSH